MKNILLILGAGASCNLGFPRGADLLDQVIEGLKIEENKNVKEGEGKDPSDLVNKLLSPKIESLWGEQAMDEEAKIKWLNGLKAFLEQHREEHSIDYLINDYPDEKRLAPIIGQYAIAYYLQGKETESLQSGRFFDDARWWATGFWKAYLGRRGEWETSQKHIRIITFNYERTFEHALFLQLWDRNVRMGTKEHFPGQDFMKNSVHHVYGDLGKYLPPYRLPDQLGVPYGFPNNRDEGILNAAKLVRLIYDHRNRQNEIPFTEWYEWANRIYFLGYGFDPDNMEKLNWGAFDQRNKEIAGTRYGMGEGVFEGIKCLNKTCEKFWSDGDMKLD